MYSTSSQPATSSERESELSQLIKSFSSAREAGDSAQALRSIDRAWRLAPDNPEINFLYGRVRLSEQAFDAATRLFAKAAAGRTYPDYEAAYISALCAAGQMETARQRLDRALRVFMVEPDGALAQAARDVAAASTGIPGWIAIGPDLTLHGEIVGLTGTARLEIAGDSFPPYLQRIKCDAGRPHTPFAVPIGTTAPGHITARLHDTILPGGKLDFPPDFGLDGRVKLAKGVFSGWVSLKWDPSRPLQVTVSGENNFSMTLQASPDPTQLDRQLFSIDAAACAIAGNALTVRVIMPDGRDKELPVSPFLIRPSRAPVRQGAPPHAAPERRAIDIVIPVYSGVDDTLTCIRSAIATAGGQAEIVVINDASPDPDMAAGLGALAATGAITLLDNPRNLGFPATANRGMDLHPDRDVVLLNADTELYGDWLARLRAAAYREPNISTVTPLTNSGSIASYPASENPDLPRADAAALDRLAAHTNAGITIDIPTAVGFCMYVRRDSIDAVGAFDDELFASGYGEENDFCLRAAKAGWRHLLAADIYVRHAGSRSFGDRRAALLERNLRLLNIRYRGYDSAIQAYMQRDPAHLARLRLDEARLTDAGGRHVLVVSLALDGGVFRAVQERLAALRKTGLKTLLLTPDRRHGVCRLTADASGLDDLSYDFATDAAELDALLHRLDLDHVELHHFLDQPPALIDSLFDLGCPVDITVHDYVWYCPRITLLDKSGRYCGEPDVNTCQLCIDQNGGRLKEDIPVAALRARSAGWLGAARTVSVPSPGVAHRMTAQFPNLAFRVEPLESGIPAPIRAVLKASATDSIKVAVVGAIGDHKGFKILLSMARHAARHDLPLEFIVIGFTRNDRALIDTGKVFVTGRYEEDEVADLIRREQPDVILFLSVFPESWSYSLTHALRARIPVAALELGAIGDRLRGTPAEDLLFPLSLSPADLCDRLLLAFQPPPIKDRNNINPLSNQNESSGLPRKPDILHDAPVLPAAAKSSRTVMAPTSTEPTASVSFLPLSQGLYLFSVRSNHANRPAGDQLSLPAMQVAAAPGTLPGQIDFMLSASTVNGWLVDWNDQIVAKVTGPSVLVCLTSVLVPGMTPLEIEVQRLDQARLESPAVAAAPAQAQFPPLAETPNSLPLDITAHVQNHGDLAFHEAQWAGMPEQHLWIESIAISPRAEIAADMIEYKAITATGVETPWVTGGAPCGTRGIGVPITGFSLRVKPQAGARQLTCEYGAICLSGGTIGPVRNGVPCYSADASDPITAIWVSISGKLDAAAGALAPAKKPEKKPETAKKATAPSGAPAVSSVKSKKPKIGPRFSVFREPSPSEHD